MKKGLTLEEHIALGEELRSIRERLLKRGVDVANKYPKTSKAARLAMAAHVAVDALRCELDNRLFAEHPGAPGLKDVYY